MRVRTAIFTIYSLFLYSSLFSQGASWNENFESAVIPSLPPGWESSRSGTPPQTDAATTTSLPHSGSNAIIVSNARKSQWFSIPEITNFYGSEVKLEFFDRRSSSFTSGILVEWDGDGDTAFSEPPDTLHARVFDSYSLQQLTHKFDHEPRTLRIRWRMMGNGTGATGTYRVDDIILAAEKYSELRIRWCLPVPRSPQSGDRVQLKACIENSGTAPARNVPVFALLDADNDSLASADEITVTMQIDSLESSDSCIVEFDLGALRPARYRCGICSVLPDSITEVDGCFWTEFTVRPAQNSLVINEIMFAPLPGMPEYVELYNTSEEDVDLSKWILADAVSPASGRCHQARIPSGESIRAKGYYVIASDSSITGYFTIAEECLLITGRTNLSLNNDSDAVRLCDPEGNGVDSVLYSSTWHSPDRTNTAGISIERLDPARASSERRNWASSTDEDGGTPGRRNSVAPAPPVRYSSITILPNPFSPDGDMIDDSVTISVRLPVNSAMVRMRIFDAAGRLVRTLMRGAPTGPSCSAVWDGYDERRRRCRIGLYILYIEAIEGQSGTCITQKKIITLAGRL